MESMSQGVMYYNLYKLKVGKQKWINRRRPIMYRIKCNDLLTRCNEKVFSFGLAGVTTPSGHFLWNIYCVVNLFHFST